MDGFQQPHLPKPLMTNISWTLLLSASVLRVSIIAFFKFCWVRFSVQPDAAEFQYLTWSDYLSELKSSLSLWISAAWLHLLLGLGLFLLVPSSTFLCQPHPGYTGKTTQSALGITIPHGLSIFRASDNNNNLSNDSRTNSFTCFLRACFPINIIWMSSRP